MMNKKIYLALPFLLTACPAYAMDFTSYVSAKGGITNDLPNIIDGNTSSAAFLGSVGVKTVVDGIHHLRGELEYVHEYNKYRDPGSLSYPYGINTNTNQIQANVFIDFLNDYKLKPYIGYGIGYAKTKTKALVYEFGGSWVNMQYRQDCGGWVNTSYRNDYFVHGFLLGFSFDITNSLSGDVGLRYMKLSDYNKILPYSNRYTYVSRNMITAGIRYTF